MPQPPKRDPNPELQDLVLPDFGPTDLTFVPQEPQPPAVKPAVKRPFELRRLKDYIAPMGIRVAPTVAGARIGASFGAPFGPWGAAAGAAVGGGVGAFGGSLLAQKSEVGHGMRERVSPKLALGEGAFGALPLTQFKNVTRAGQIWREAARGGSVGLGAGITLPLLEGHRPSLEELLVAPALGATMGVGAGAVLPLRRTTRISRRTQTPPPPPLTDPVLDLPLTEPLQVPPSSTGTTPVPWSIGGGRVRVNDVAQVVSPGYLPPSTTFEGGGPGFSEGSTTTGIPPRRPPPPAGPGAGGGAAVAPDDLGAAQLRQELNTRLRHFRTLIRQQLQTDPEGAMKAVVAMDPDDLFGFRAAAVEEVQRYLGIPASKGAASTRGKAKGGTLGPAPATDQSIEAQFRALEDAIGHRFPEASRDVAPKFANRLISLMQQRNWKQALKLARELSVEAEYKNARVLYQNANRVTDADVRRGALTSAAPSVEPPAAPRPAISPRTADAEVAAAPSPPTEPIAPVISPRKPGNKPGRISATRTWDAQQEAAKAAGEYNKRHPGAEARAVKAVGGKWTISALETIAKPEGAIPLRRGSRQSSSRQPTSTPNVFITGRATTPGARSRSVRPTDTSAFGIEKGSFGVEDYTKSTMAELIEAAADARSAKQTARLTNIEAEINRRSALAPPSKPRGKRVAESTPAQRAAERPEPTDAFGLPLRPTESTPSTQPTVGPREVREIKGLEPQLATDMIARLKQAGIRASYRGGVVRVWADVDLPSWVSEYGVTSTTPPTSGIGPGRQPRAASLTPRPDRPVEEPLPANVSSKPQDVAEPSPREGGFGASIGEQLKSKGVTPPVVTETGTPVTKTVTISSRPTSMEVSPFDAPPIGEPRPSPTAAVKEAPPREDLRAKKVKVTKKRKGVVLRSTTPEAGGGPAETRPFPKAGASPTPSSTSASGSPPAVPPSDATLPASSTTPGSPPAKSSAPSPGSVSSGTRAIFFHRSKGELPGVVENINSKGVVTFLTDRGETYLIGKDDLRFQSTPTRDAEVTTLREQLRRAPSGEQAGIRARLKALLGKNERGETRIFGPWRRKLPAPPPPPSAPPGYRSPAPVARQREARLAEKRARLFDKTDRWTRFRQIFQDKDLEALQAQDAVQKAGVTASRFYQELKATKGGGSGLIEADIHEFQKIFNDLDEKNLAQPFLDYLELQGYMHVVGKGEQQAALGKGQFLRRMLRGKVLPEELTPGQVEARLIEFKKKLTPEDYAAVEAAGEATAKLINGPLDLSVNAGVISKETAAQWKARGGIYQHQDKLYARTLLTQRERLRALQHAGALTGPAVHTLAELEGAPLLTKDPLLATFEKSNHIYREALRSQTLKLAFDDLSAPGSPFAHTPGKPGVRLLGKNEHPSEGFVALSFYDPAKPGILQRAQFPTELGNLFLNATGANIGLGGILFGPTGFIGAINRLWKKGVVVWSSGFAAVNPFRDIRNARQMVPEAFTAYDPSDALRTYSTEYARAVRDVLDKHPDYLRALRNRELQATFMKTAFPERFTEQYWNSLAAMSGVEPVAKKAPWGIAVTNLASALEEATKLMTSRRLWNAGVSPDKIRDIVRARGGSPDFAVGGEARDELEALFVLLNANVQGLTQSASFIRRMPKRLFQVALAATIGTMYRDHWNSSFTDEEGELELTHVPNSVRDSSYVVFLPIQVETGEGNKRWMYVSWPKAHVDRIIYTPIETAFEVARGATTPARAASRMATNLLPSGGEIDPKHPVASLGRSLAANLGPGFRVPAEISSNLRTFSGAPIMPERLKGVIQEQQYTAFTSFSVKKSSEIFGLSTKLGISPITIEYLLRNSVPGVADAVIGAADYFGAEIIGESTGDPSTLGKIRRFPVAGPVFRRFVGPGAIDQVLVDRRERFYTALDKVMQAQSTISLMKRRVDPDAPVELVDYLSDDAVAKHVSKPYANKFRDIAVTLSKIGRARETLMFELMRRPPQKRVDEIHDTLRKLAAGERVNLKASDTILKATETLPPPPHQ